MLGSSFLLEGWFLPGTKYQPRPGHQWCSGHQVPAPGGEAAGGAGRCGLWDEAGALGMVVLRSQGGVQALAEGQCQKGTCMWLRVESDVWTPPGWGRQVGKSKLTRSRKGRVAAAAWGSRRAPP